MGLSLHEVASRRAWPEDETLAIAEALVVKKLLRVLSRSPVFMVSAVLLDACAMRLREAVAEFHMKKPLIHCSSDDLPGQGTKHSRTTGKLHCSRSISINL